MFEKNPDEIRKMFDEISKRYDLNNNLISFFMHKIFKKKALESLLIEDNFKILDLCCGSGDISNLLYEMNPNCEIIGVDFSSSMLKIAKSKNGNIKYIEADAINLPFDDDTFDIVVIAFGLRNIQNQDKALNEIYRVLKSQGQFLHLDFEGKNKFSRFYDSLIKLFLGLFVKNLTPYMYLLKSKNEFYKSKELVEKFLSMNFKFVKSEKKFFNTVSYHLFKKN